MLPPVLSRVFISLDKSLTGQGDVVSPLAEFG